MDRTEIIEKLAGLFAIVPGNKLVRENGIKKKYIGTVMFDAPIAGVASADDALFDKFKETGVIGPWHMNPNEWLDGAKTVISLFFPITEEVRKSNYEAKSVGSKQWVYARIDGQAYITEYMEALKTWFEENGVRACEKRCPVNAIDMEKGKDHIKCHGNVTKSGIIHYPRYGCGLCQTKVPCESERPLKPTEK